MRVLLVVGDSTDLVLLRRVLEDASDRRFGLMLERVGGARSGPGRTDRALDTGA